MSSPSLPFIQVTVTIGGKPLQTYTFSEQEILIGRGLDCQVPLDNPGASRHHAKIVRQGDDLILQDLESGNGTTVNGKPITQVKLKSGDMIVISKFNLAVKLTDQRQGAPIPSPHVESGPVQSEHTVFLSAQDRAKITQQAQPGGRPSATVTSVKPAPQQNSSWVMVFVAGVVVGALLGWMLHP